MGFIQRYLLPKEVDFNGALLTQAQIAHEMVACLHEASAGDDIARLAGIGEMAARARAAKEHNMEVLLDVFITPYDKESIYRLITQLDWVALSVKHFELESHVYGIHSLAEYLPIVEILLEMAQKLEDGIGQLSRKKVEPAQGFNRELHDAYDNVVNLCARATAALLDRDDIKRLIRHKDMLLQFKEIAKRIHISSNSLEDMMIKLV